jgi:hypothetical protein
MEPWVELRVHGVSGTPEREMLETDAFRPAGGDGTVAHVRRTDRAGRFLPPGEDGRILEAGAVAWARLGPAGRRRRPVVAAMYTPDGATGPRLPAAGVHRVARAIASARLKNGLEPVALGAGGLAVVLSAAAVVEQVGGGWCDRAACAPGDLPAPWGWGSAVAADGTWQAVVVTAGAAALVVLAGVVAWLGHQALGGSGAGADWRRRVNVVWDVVAFWPRTAHPFVP